MATLAVGDKAPDFSKPGDGHKTLSLQELRGSPVILYFYPKDDTPGCTQESCDFRDNMAAFQKVKAQIIGISRDKVKSHDKFVEKYQLNFPLLSDEDGSVCEAYGTWVEKSMYGKKYMGIERSTFLIDEEGVIRAIWRKVKVTDHVKDVIGELQNLK